MSDHYSLRREIDGSGLFDKDWYVARYRDVAGFGLEPLAHFLRFGVMLNRDPGPEFDARFYLSQYQDVKTSGTPALVHYIRHGRAEGRAARPSDLAVPQMAVVISNRPATAAADATWDYRVATDAFMQRGLVPCAAVVVVANIAQRAEWQEVLTVLADLDCAHDLFLQGPDKLDFSTLPDTTRSVTQLGPADAAGDAKGFVRLVEATALERYSAALWLSPQDTRSGVGIVDLARVAGLAKAYQDDADWGCASEALGRLDSSADPVLLRAVSTAAARLGLTLPGKSLAFPSGAAVWLRPMLLRVLGPTVRPFEMTATGEGASFPGRATVLAMLGVAAQQGGMATRLATRTPPQMVSAAAAERQVKAIAFYLPQFHPIAENDKWWGKGFTEWNNVVRGKPLFRNHYQPRLPADLGFYDLRLEDTQVAQADLARQFGIHGFCYYYYWFNGTKLLNQPIEQMARGAQTDAGFCVCWANENWSRNWDGQNRHVLMEQQYSLESNRALMLELIPMMKDSRWIRYQGKPVMVVYRIAIIPNWLETARIWRDECRRAGLGEIHLCAVRFGLETLQGQPQDHGLDSYVLFPPHEAPRTDLRSVVQDLHKEFGGEIFSYDAVVDGDIAKYAGGYDWPVHRSAMLGWDNTARRLTSARIFHGATPYGFRRWIKGILEQEARHNPATESLLFINAWNEWAEGTYLEPDQRWGISNLEALASAAASVPGVRMVPTPKGTALRPKTAERLAAAVLSQDRNAAALQSPVWYPGVRQANPAWPTVLLSAHISGHHLFGGERSLLDVLAALSTMPLNVVMTLPSGNNPGYIDEICKRSLGVYVFPYPQWMDNRAAYGWLGLTFADIIARHGVDIAHVNTIVLLEPLVAARRLGRTALVHSRELISLDEPLRARMQQSAGEIVEAVFRHSDWVVGNSRATCALFDRGEQTLYVPNAVGPADLDMPNPLGEAITFGIVSSNIPKKGVADFVEVARRAAAVATCAKFVVIGPNSAQIDAWAAEVERGERPANLSFAGYRSTPREAMAELNVLLNLSSFAESFGRTVAEALAARRPVIAYNWGALPELIQHGETGYLVPYKDIDAVVAAVAELCATPAKIAAMGEKGRAFISRNFSHDSLRGALAEGYERIFARPMRGQAKLPGAKPHISASQTIGAAPRTTVVIPVYNAPEDLRTCLDSVLRHTDLAQARVLVIDDGSPDPAVKPVLDSFEGIAGLTILRNGPNIGYTRTINLGIVQAGTDDVVLLNSDTIVTPKWLEGLRATAYSRPRVATVTAMSDNAGAFSFPVFDQICRKPDHLSHEEYALLMVQATFGCNAPEVPTGSGFCMFIRRALIDACGLFDAEGFPRGYGEENDFCMRAHKAGWVNLVSPWSFVFHVRTASFKGEKAQLVQTGVDVVTRRYPDYADLVRAAFAAPQMLALRAAAEKAADG